MYARECEERAPDGFGAEGRPPGRRWVFKIPLKTSASAGRACPSDWTTSLVDLMTTASMQLGGDHIISEVVPVPASPAAGRPAWP